MNKLLLLAVTTALLLSAGLSMAANEMIVTPMKSDVRIVDFENFGMTVAEKCGEADKAPQCCKIGNRNPWAYAVQDFVTGNQSFSYMFFAEPSCGCETGFTTGKIRIAIQVGEEDVPLTLEANASFEETQFNDTGDYLVPGPVICTSPNYSATITEPGAYICEIPMPADCLCAAWGYDYALTMNLVSTLESPIDLIVDDIPVGGVSWMDQGRGWEDLAGYQFPGELKMATKINCCSEPVDDNQESWGNLKALFR